MELFTILKIESPIVIEFSNLLILSSYINFVMILINKFDIKKYILDFSNFRGDR